MRESVSIQQASEVIERVPDEATRTRIWAEIGRGLASGKAFSLTPTSAKAWEKAYGEWEREEGLKRQPIETTGKIKGTFELPEGEW